MRGTTVEERRDLWRLETDAAKMKEQPVKPMKQLLEELKKEELLDQEEVEIIIADANNEITIGSRTIRFKIEDDISTPEPPVNPDEPEELTPPKTEGPIIDLVNDGTLKIGDYVAYKPDIVNKSEELEKNMC